MGLALSAFQEPAAAAGGESKKVDRSETAAAHGRPRNTRTLDFGCIGALMSRILAIFLFCCVHRLPCCSFAFSPSSGLGPDNHDNWFVPADDAVVRQVAASFQRIRDVQGARR